MTNTTPVNGDDRQSSSIPLQHPSPPSKHNITHQHTTMSDNRPAWLPDWDPMPGETLSIIGHINSASPTSTTATEDGNDAYRTTTTIPGGLVTNFVGDSAQPLWFNQNDFANASVNVAAVGAVNPMVVGGHAGVSLGMLTVLCMVYNVVAGLGLGILVWKVSFFFS